jgi:hypothetical protein
MAVMRPSLSRMIVHRGPFMDFLTQSNKPMKYVDAGAARPQDWLEAAKPSAVCLLQPNPSL